MRSSRTNRVLVTALLPQYRAYNAASGSFKANGYRPRLFHILMNGPPVRATPEFGARTTRN